ncbi:M24 family metallopeptidase [Aestuariibius sp. 2305UL40-4]|uniref:M24 family metallopeptidase n=1 Tax=Aestuariibius violaceus TaxID=3234132 RepID=UPI00345E19D8
MGPAFERTEYHDRVTRVQALMAERGLDALYLGDPSNMNWLTGYDGWSFYVPQGVILTAEGEPWWWGRAMDAAGAVRTVWMGSERIVSYAETLVQSDSVHPMEDLAARFADLRVLRIGVEADGYWYTARADAVLRAGSPGVDIVDIGDAVRRCRAVKSDAEVAVMRAAARIAERAMAVALEHARPGVRRNEVAAAIMAAQIEGADGQWGDYPAIVPMLPAGADAAAPHLTWDGRPLVAGEAIFFELAGCVRRYHVPHCRTAMLGDVPAAMARAEAVAGDVARALTAALARAGIEKDGRCGYAVGLSYPPDWGERTISFRADDETVLEPGMTFHFMPGLWMEDWGIEITETILIRRDGPAECLCDMPRPIARV